MANFKAENEKISASLLQMRDRASQEPISYKPLFGEAHRVACSQFARAVHAEAENFAADRALCNLLGEFGWATGHGDKLVDLIEELAINLRKYREAGEMTKRCYGGCLKDLEQLYAEGRRLFAGFREIDKIAEWRADVDNGIPNDWMLVRGIVRNSLTAGKHR